MEWTRCELTLGFLEWGKWRELFEVFLTYTLTEQKQPWMTDSYLHSTTLLPLQAHILKIKREEIQL